MLILPVIKTRNERQFAYLFRLGLQPSIFTLYLLSQSKRTWDPTV